MDLQQIPNALLKANKGKQSKGQKQLTNQTKRERYWESDKQIYVQKTGRQENKKVCIMIQKRWLLIYKHDILRKNCNVKRYSKT